MIYGFAHKQSKSDRFGISLMNLPVGNQLGLYISYVAPRGAFAPSQLRAGMRIVSISINGTSYNTMIGWTSAFAACFIQDSVGSIMITALDNDQHGTTATATTSFTTLAAPFQPESTQQATHIASIQQTTQMASIQPSQQTEIPQVPQPLKKCGKCGIKKKKWSYLNVQWNKLEDNERICQVCTKDEIKSAARPTKKDDSSLGNTDKKAALQAVKQSAIREKSNQHSRGDDKKSSPIQSTSKLAWFNKPQKRPVQ